MNALTVKKITKSFGAVHALDSVSFSIRKGEVFGLLGPNGAGKTTLISILCGFLIADSGSARILEMNCDKERQNIRKRMNFISGFGGITEYFTAREALRFYASLYNMDNIDERVDSALKATGLWDYRNRVASDFSSGLGRRYLLSKALLNDPDVVLLDEPTVGLDVESAERARKIISDLKKKGKTILLTTHNMREAGELCDRLALIRKGKIIDSGTYSELSKKYFRMEGLKIECKKKKLLEGRLKKISGISSIKKRGRALTILYEKKSDTEKIIAAAMECGIIRIRSIEPDLEDIYSKVMRSA
jgi:ABC-2 type transport system ATP-binding protein